MVVLIYPRGDGVEKHIVISKEGETWNSFLVVEGRRHPTGDASLIIAYITTYIDNIYCIYSSLSLGVFFYNVKS